jgi:alanine racemase
MFHPTRYLIDCDALRHNISVIRAAIGPRPMLMAVVKANAYGHGAVACARILLEAGARWCGVATLPEAIALRDAGISAPVLVMGYTPGRFAEEAIARDIRLCAYDIGVVHDIAAAARRLDKHAQLHLKIDTGMGRLGVLPTDAPALIDAASTTPGIVVEGLMTHLACSESDPDYSREQLRLFEQATAGRSALRHACNSGGVFGHPQGHFDMVRPGLALYGLSPYAPAEPANPLVHQLRPVLQIETEIASVKTLPDGAGVGYGRRYRCEGARRVAVIPIGYGDGFRRSPHNAGHVLVRGQRAPILGTVCMDQTMIDVTHIDGTHIGDPVVVLGRQGGQRISADDIAARLGTINYEVTTQLLARPERVYG